MGQRHILYDATLIEHPNAALFSPSAETTSTAQGRGDAIFFQAHGLELVLKHYQRGGMMVNLLGDRYLGRKIENTRSVREWCLLRTLQTLNLPAPVPVIASVIRAGLFYRADLITRQIEHSETLADRLLVAELSAENWRAVGQCIKQFHDSNVYHADLNARNILIDENDKVYLIDFDKGGIRVLGESWKLANVARLQRSLLKFKTINPNFHYSESDWKIFLKGYSS